MIKICYLSFLICSQTDVYASCCLFYYNRSQEIPWCKGKTTLQRSSSQDLKLFTDKLNLYVVTILYPSCFNCSFKFPIDLTCYLDPLLHLIILFLSFLNCVECVNCQIAVKLSCLSPLIVVSLWILVINYSFTVLLSMPMNRSKPCNHASMWIE